MSMSSNPSQTVPGGSDGSADPDRPKKQTGTLCLLSYDPKAMILGSVLNDGQPVLKKQTLESEELMVLDFDPLYSIKRTCRSLLADCESLPWRPTAIHTCQQSWTDWQRPHQLDGDRYLEVNAYHFYGSYLAPRSVELPCELLSAAVWGVNTLSRQILDSRGGLLPKLTDVYIHHGGMRGKVPDALHVPADMVLPDGRENLQVITPHNLMRLARDRSLSIHHVLLQPETRPGSITKMAHHNGPHSDINLTLWAHNAEYAAVLYSWNTSIRYSNRGGPDNPDNNQRHREIHVFSNDSKDHKCYKPLLTVLGRCELDGWRSTDNPTHTVNIVLYPYTSVKSGGTEWDIRFEKLSQNDQDLVESNLQNLLREKDESGQPMNEYVTFTKGRLNLTLPVMQIYKHLFPVEERWRENFEIEFPTVGA